MLPQAEVLQDWKGLSDSQWSNKPKPSWLQGPFHKLTLPQLPADFSHASTASQIQQLVALCVVPVMLAKHQIKGIEDLMRLPSPATTGRQPKLPLVRIPQQPCLLPSKLLVRWGEGLAFEENGHCRLTLQRTGRSWNSKAVRLATLICHARHGPPAVPRLVPKHLCGNHSCIHPEHISWETQSDNTLHARHKHTPMHIPTVAQNQQARAEAQQARAEAKQAAALLYLAENVV